MTSSSRSRATAVVGLGARSLAAGAVAAGLVAALGLGGMLPVSGAQAASSSNSAVTIEARQQDTDAENAPFPDLAVTVSQTRDLQQQGVRISWTGAKKSVPPTQQTGGEDYLQIFQCWGEDPTKPGHADRTSCQYGGAATPGATRDANRRASTTIPEADLRYTVAAAPPARDAAYTSIPFIARDGTVVSSVDTDANGKTSINSVKINENQFFTRLTTNEIPWAGSGADGTGSVSFEVQTAAQAPALGCGAASEVAGEVVGASCWLVILPRAKGDNGASNSTTSGLFWDSWQHALSVKLDFRPLGVRCPEGQAERQIEGSELASLAVQSWQPSLCQQSGGSVFSLITGAESDALGAASASNSPSLALTSRASESADDPLSYAPVALTGVAISFAIDRFPNNFGTVPDAALGRAQLPLTSMNLTPRLVAKLLTNSYIEALPPGGDRAHIGFIDAEHPGKNAYNLTKDPDFLAVNDEEWSYQSIGGAAVADMLVPQGRSDAAYAMWSYVAADAEARDFLAGKPDPWGMVVNPWSSTDASLNKSGTSFAVPRDTFPKADPIEVPATTSGGLIIQGAVNLVTWRPYTNDLDSSAYLTVRGDGQLLGSFDSFATPPRFGKASRSLPGFQAVIGVTDTASASRYGVVTAALRNPAGKFVSPTNDSLQAAAAAMTPSAQNPEVFGFDPTSSAARAASDAYPLASPIFAAANGRIDDAQLRASYARFIEYAVGDGQTPGDKIGQLPAGFAPIPDGWRAAARKTANAIASGTKPFTFEAGVSGPTGTTSQQASTAAANQAVAPVSAANAATPATATAPQAQGDAAPALLGSPTPDDPDTGAIAAALPLSAAAGVLAAVAVPIVSRRRIA